MSLACVGQDGARKVKTGQEQGQAAQKIEAASPGRSLKKESGA